MLDPTAPKGWLISMGFAMLRTSPFRWFVINVSPRVDPWLMRVSGGRLCTGPAKMMALLTTMGAKSGERRTNPVLYFHDGDAVVVVASSYGRERHPGWYYNIRKNPQVAISKSGDGIPTVAEIVAEGAELARLWALADQAFPLFPDYRARAAAAGRAIPVIRLTSA
ncbi:MAG: nitroreductase/quinone reductase family protein [Segniliparus sp.]|uniref:nitroreductase/quinone reductase family protein n=1 Tax=Segniliparus sp. TaxID=2804064 RepID=UPI003F2D8F43